MDVKGFHIRVSAKMGELRGLYPQGFLYLVTRDVVEKRLSAGTIHEVSVANAARHLVENTHDIATPEQVDAYLAHNDVIRDSLLAGQNAAAGGRLNVTIRKP